MGMRGQAVKLSRAGLSRGVLALALLAAVAACNKDDRLEGERLDIRAPLDGAAAPAAPQNQSRPIAVPGMVGNSEWTHRGGTPGQFVGNVALSPAPHLVWASDIGQGDSRRLRITADPVVGGGRVFTLDSEATVAATSTGGGKLWQTSVVPDSERVGDAMGGGLAYAGGRVFATTGYGELVALDAATGGVIWRQSFSAPVSGAPTVSGNSVYVAARDGTGWSVRVADGRVEWEVSAVFSISGVTGVSAPAVDGDLVIFPYSGGELIAAKRSGGERAWVGQVAGERVGRAYTSVSDLTGDPVVAGGQLYVGSSAGRLVSMDARSGARRWTANEGATSPVSVFGGSVFLISDESQLIRLDANTGAQIWAIDLPHYTKTKERKRRDIFAHYGPVLAGGRLRVASSDGVLRSFDPASGAMLSEVALPEGAASAPVVAGSTLYVVNRDGQLLAFR